jgi:hypothetical protein
MGMLLFISFFFLALPFLLIRFLDSWIYLSATCLLDYNPIEVSVYYACPFDGVWKSIGEYLAPIGSHLHGTKMLACVFLLRFLLIFDACSNEIRL